MVLVSNVLETNRGAKAPFGELFRGKVPLPSLFRPSCPSQGCTRPRGCSTAPRISVILFYFSHLLTLFLGRCLRWPSLPHLAIGLGDLTVPLFHRHLVQSIFCSSSSTSLTSLLKPRTIHESPTEPITALGFTEPVISSAHEVQTIGNAPAQR